MRDHSQHIELSRENAVREIIKLLPNSFGKGRFEQVALEAACGRVLARDVHYKTDVPNALTCCMDSVAVHWDNFASLGADELPDTSSWVRGIDWEFANTGTAMPEGFDAAIVIEHIEVSDDEQRISLTARPSERLAGTRAAGSTATRGDLAVSAGTFITPDVAAKIASAGVASVCVVAKPKVAFIPTGNELVAPNVPYCPTSRAPYAGAGKVFESNSMVVRGKAEQWGGTFVPFDIVPDERQAIEDAVRLACSVADIVVLNAGSSKGSDDWSVEVLEKMGQMVCHQTNHGPGHHSSYALVDGTPVVGISGPSGGASFTLNFYLLPLMRHYYGISTEPRTIPAKLTKDFPAGHMQKQAQMQARMEADNKPVALPGEQRPADATGPHKEFFSVKFVTLEANAEGQLQATPVAGRPGSASAEAANAYYMMPAGASATPPKVGEIIHVELRNQSLV